MIRCPVCRSIDIYRIAGGCIGEVYRCKHCGYSGSFMLEEDDLPAEVPHPPGRTTRPASHAPRDD